MSWIYELKFQKLFGLYHKWLLLRTKEEFLEITQLCEEAQTEGRPDPPARLPCMVWLYDAGPSECGSFPTAVYFYFTEAQALVEAEGFETIKKKLLSPEEW